MKSFFARAVALGLLFAPIAARAGPESGARRSLSPLPRTGISGDLAVAIDFLRLKASDTRNPDP